MTQELGENYSLWKTFSFNLEYNISQSCTFSPRSLFPLLLSSTFSLPLSLHPPLSFPLSFSISLLPLSLPPLHDCVLSEYSQLMQALSLLVAGTCNT